MLQVGSALKGYAIEAEDGQIGSVSDLLFDDSTWKVRWLVVDTGNWLTGRLVLIHPSAVWRVNYVDRTVSLALTKARIEASPDLSEHQPVSRRVENNLYGYYGWDSVWGDNFLLAPETSPAIMPSPYFSEPAKLETETGRSETDPHLRSVSVVTGYDIHANDGAIGHVQDILLEDNNWTIRYLVVDTKNWWPGQHVLISPYAVIEISASKQQVFLGISRGQVKASPPWSPLDLIDQAYEKRLHGHYDWPGYGW